MISTFGVGNSTYAQNIDSVEYNKMVDILPEFRGSADSSYEFLKYVASELIYPSEAIRDSFEGRVIVHFIVDSTGAVTRPEFLDSVPTYIKREVERVLLSSPKWTPGRMFDGKNVNVIYFIPVTFSMDETVISEESAIQTTDNKRRIKRRKTTGKKR